MIDKATERAVISAFGLGKAATPLEYVARGVEGEVYRATTASGTWALKRLFRAPDLEQVELEVRLQEAVNTAGIRSPRAGRTTDDHLVAEVEDTHWRANEWISASPVGPDRLADVGSALALIHKLRLPAPRDVLPWLTTPPSHAAWEELRATVNQASPGWAPRFAELYPELVRLGDLAAAVTATDAVLSHCDLGPPNLGVVDDHVVIFDWGRAGAIPPLQELGSVLWAWADVGDPEVVLPALLAGYRGQVADRIDIDLETFGCAGAGWLNFFYACASAGNDQFVVPMLDRPMTLDALRSLLTYVT